MSPRKGVYSLKFLYLLTMFYFVVVIYFGMMVIERNIGYSG